jgi:hypothetical protein
MEHGTHHVYSSSVNEQLLSSKKNCDMDSHLEGDDAELFYSPSPRNDLLVKDLEPKLSQISATGSCCILYPCVLGDLLPCRDSSNIT